mmetsp:Transcript_69165/g.178289  ORF Transcript_69165/g.178289 Transcript_69165/m.178289 type:complete len:246 (-) Transcript_69165:141-878(-)
MEHDAQAPEVAGAGVALTVFALHVVQHLRRRVRVCANVGPHGPVLEVLGEAPIYDLNVRVRPLPAAEANVFHLQVSMCYAAAMCILERASNLLRDASDHVLVHPAALHEPVEQIATLKVLDDEEHEMLRIVCLKKTADARVVQVFHDADLLLQSVGQVLIKLAHLLDGDKSILEHPVLGDVDLAVCTNADAIAIDLVPLRDLHIDALGHEGPRIEAHPLHLRGTRRLVIALVEVVAAGTTTSPQE